jgi:CTP synthase
MDAILVPGGFGERGIEGKIAPVRYARENKIPYLGICLGMQLASIEYGRHVLGLENANSTEFNRPLPIRDRADHRMAGLPQRASRSVTTAPAKGGTMRLGAQDVFVGVEHAGASHLRRRDRARAPPPSLRVQQYLSRSLHPDGLPLLGALKDDLVEIIELPGHPWFVATQFTRSSLHRHVMAIPLFAGFVISGAAASHGAIAGSRERLSGTSCFRASPRI